MFMNILKFIGLLCVLGILNAYVPFGRFITAAIIIYALWKLAAELK